MSPRFYGWTDRGDLPSHKLLNTNYCHKKLNASLFFETYFDATQWSRRLTKIGTKVLIYLGIEANIVIVERKKI
jgi:hypothetical protein